MLTATSRPLKIPDMLNSILTIVLQTVQISLASPIDCSKIADFTPFESVSVEISIERFYWEDDHGNRVQKSQQVCNTSKPLEVGAFDIRGREVEWYYCFYQKVRPDLECSTNYRGKPATIVVRPANVIRSYPNQAGARDTHAHVFLVPESDWNKYRDTFVRSMSFDLKKQDVLIDSVSGGQGQDSGEDSYGVRLHYY